MLACMCEKPGSIPSTTKHKSQNLFSTSGEEDKSEASVGCEGKTAVLRGSRGTLRGDELGLSLWLPESRW